MNDDFGQRLKELRKSKGITQTELANMLHLSDKSSISRYEKGKNRPQFDIITKIADILDVSVDYLLGKTEEKTSKTKLDNGVKTIAAKKININEDLPDEAIDKINEYIKMVEMMYKDKS